MTHERNVVDAVCRALHSEPRVHPADRPMGLAFANGELTMEGEVDHIAGKKLGLEAAACVPGVSRIIDQLRVRPTTPVGDGEIQGDHPIGPARSRRRGFRQPLDKGLSPASPIAATPAAKPDLQGDEPALNRQILQPAAAACHANCAATSRARRNRGSDDPLAQ